MPKTLDAVGQEAWRELTKALDDMNVMTLADRSAMEFYCITYSQYRQAVDSVNQYGQVLVSKRADGTPTVTRNPYSVEMHKLRDACTKLLTEMGLTPASRARLKATPKENEEDPLIKMLKERAGDN